MDVPRSMGSIKIGNNGSNSFYDDNSDNEDTIGDYLGDDQRDMKFIEVWDYFGGTSFRGFIAHKALPHGQVEKTLFLFFEHVAGTQLKQGLITLIELASECFSCERLVICLERNAEGLHGLVRDLGWVGFELVTLAHWIQQHDIPKAPGSSLRSGSFSSVSTTSSVFSEDDVTSEKWLFMGMEL